MSKVFAMHGVVENMSRSLFSHRNLIDAAAFKEHLSRLPAPYVDIYEAVECKGDALTIDDATDASASAALCARALDHAVTLFVNPFNITSALTYDFLELNLILDAATEGLFVFDRHEYDLSKFKARKRLRVAIKHQLCRLPQLEQWRDFISGLASELRVPRPSIPTYLRPITVAQLLELKSAGVRIENHGWTHRHVSPLSWVEILADINQGKDWLTKTCGVPTELYAVPFGDCLPKSIDAEGAYQMWFTLDDVLNPGFVGPNVYNRVSLKV